MAVGKVDKMAALAKIMFADAEPTREVLEEQRELLGVDGARFVPLFLNMRLGWQWQGFDVTHQAVVYLDQNDNSVEIRVYEPDSDLYALRYALAEGGLIVGNFRDVQGGMGGWLKVSAPDSVVRRLRKKC